MQSYSTLSAKFVFLLFLLQQHLCNFFVKSFPQKHVYLSAFFLHRGKSFCGETLQSTDKSQKSNRQSPCLLFSPFCFQQQIKLHSSQRGKLLFRILKLLYNAFLAVLFLMLLLLLQLIRISNLNYFSTLKLDVI